MNWLMFSIFTAIFSATEIAFMKHWLGHLSRSEMLACMMAWSLPLFGAHWFWLGWQPVGDGFWFDVCIFLPINITGVFVQCEAVRITPLSLSLPFLAFTPAFLIIVGFLFLGELPSVYGAIGIFFIVAGSWVLTCDSTRKTDLLEPFRAIWRERGTRLALLAAFIWSLGAVYSKKIALNADPLYAGVVFFCLHNILIVAGTVFLGKASIRTIWRYRRVGTLCAIMLYLHILCHYLAISRITAAYMISIKRLNGVIAVGYGALLGDTEIGRRLAGASIMALGAAIIAIFG